MTLLDQNIIEDPDLAETRLHALKDASDVARANNEPILVVPCRSMLRRFILVTGRAKLL